MGSSTVRPSHAAKTLQLFPPAVGDFFQATVVVATRQPATAPTMASRILGWQGRIHVAGSPHRFHGTILVEEGTRELVLSSAGEGQDPRDGMAAKGACSPHVLLQGRCKTSWGRHQCESTLSSFRGAPLHQPTQRQTSWRCGILLTQWL